MKIITIILSIYLIVLSCLPCADTKLNDITIVDTSINSSHEKNSHTHEKNSDLCPPFCSCNCCAAQVLTFNPYTTFVFLQQTQLILSIVPTYNSILQSNFFGSIWQPPQIV